MHCYIGNLHVNVWFVDSVLNLWICFYLIEGMHQHTCWSGWCPDGQCLLGVVLFGTRYPTWRSDALRQNNWRRWRLLQHILQWDWSWQTRPQSCLCWSGTNSSRLVFWSKVVLLKLASVNIFRSTMNDCVTFWWHHFYLLLNK